MEYLRDLGSNPFLLSGLVAGLLASIACGVVGPYVVTRRLVFLAGAIAHIALGGIGASIYLGHRFPAAFGSLDPIIGATMVAVLAAVVLALLHDRAAEHLDTAVGALWAVGMAVGLLLVKLTPGYQPELMSYLFGNLVYVSWESVSLMLALDLVIVVTAWLFHRRFVALCLDPQQAALQGVPTLATQMVLLVLVALTVIALTQVVGLILVIALLSLPVATAARFGRRIATLIWWSIAICGILTTVPRALVYGSEISPEPAIVIAAGVLYLLALAFGRRVRERRA